MRTCASCGSPMADADRFCGDCGASAVAPSLSPAPAPLAPARPDPEATGSTTRGRPAAKAIAIPVAAAALLSLGAVLVYLEPWDQASGPPGTEPSGPAVLAPTGRPKIKTPAPPQRTKPVVDKTSASPLPAARPGESGTQDAGALIRPGRWRFVHRILDVTPADPYSKYPVDKRGVGETGSRERCISPAVARAPGQVAFPLPPEWNCRTRQFSMSTDTYAYYARFYCRFASPLKAGDVPVDGVFEWDKVFVALKTRQPGAHLGSVPNDQGYAELPDVIVHTEIDGEYVGPCR